MTFDSGNAWAERHQTQEERQKAYLQSVQAIANNSAGIKTEMNSIRGLLTGIWVTLMLIMMTMIIFVTRSCS